jgi:hypothetical protein
MTQTLKISATAARKDLFNLIDLVSNEDVIVYITKKGLDHPVVLKRETSSYVADQKRDVQIVRDSAGSLKSSVKYQPDEMEQAAKHFTQDYLKKLSKEDSIDD